MTGERKLSTLRCFSASSFNLVAFFFKLMWHSSAGKEPKNSSLFDFSLLEPNEIPRMILISYYDEHFFIKFYSKKFKLGLIINLLKFKIIFFAFIVFILSFKRSNFSDNPNKKKRYCSFLNMTI
ncbi:hypothetical protein BpHYR1_018189 [Brachionus plicatilis]|uniref:Uncharacterized protein n=1 Tax=Brachionus plicatilis TaxID=10195 RepID=A0A3M7Q345_BRAPC|nr:hypothetical protein BpHYR1_018189 [Brachionus plicatilis]